MVGRLWTAFKELDSARSLLALIVAALAATGGGAALIAWASTTWDWYWQTLSWAGVAIAFLVGFFVLSMSAFLASLACGRLSRSRTTGPRTAGSATKDQIVNALTNFERHAAEEAFIVYRWRYKDIQYVRFDDWKQKQPHKKGPLTTQEYLDWMEFFEKFEKSCDEMGLSATKDALADALRGFKSRNVNLDVAYQHFHHISKTFKNEVGRLGGLGKA
jgi:hypothetical protein